MPIERTHIIIRETYNKAGKDREKVCKSDGVIRFSVQEKIKAASSGIDTFLEIDRDACWQE